MIPETIPDPLRLLLEPLVWIQGFSESIDPTIHSDLDRADFARAMRMAYVGHLHAIEVVWRNMQPVLRRQWRDTLVDLVATRLCPAGMHSDISPLGAEFAKLIGKLKQDTPNDVPAAKIDHWSLAAATLLL